MKVRYINHVRDYFRQYTEGQLFLPDKDYRFCWLLEDIARPVNVKFAGDTCIPEGVYDVGYSVRSRFKKEMISLHNQPNGYEIKRDGISFKGIRVHGGNNVGQTNGCPLANFNNQSNGIMFGRASDELLKYIKAGMDDGIRYKWVISSGQVNA